MNLYKMLSVAVNEKDVENAYRSFISSTYKTGLFASPSGCDGYFTNNNVKMLCEFKFNTNFKDTRDPLSIIAQSIYYMKKFSTTGVDIPNTLFVGDKNELFVLSTETLLKYLKKDYDWSLPPSSAWDKNPKMKLDLLDDNDLHFMVFDVTKEFVWDTVDTYINRCAKQIKADITINSGTIVKAYEYWMQNVLNDSSVDDSTNIENFFKVLLNPTEIYVHPKKDGILNVCGKEVKIKKRGYNGFFSCYKETHNPTELKELTANKDRLMQESARRRTGAFYTPSIWVDEAHKMLAESLGENYRDEYVVWDCSCGSGQLTRDYAFKELYLSTLEEADLTIIRDSGYNQNAVKFQYDFLNDDFDKLPQGLKDAITGGKKILFLNNPPYATANNLCFKEGAKAGVATLTKVNTEMKDKKIGESSQQLYAQFMYRIMQICNKYNLNDSVMATFSTVAFMNGDSFELFRKELNKLNLINGMMFQASNFADVSDAWAIAFTVFTQQKEN